MPVVERFSNCRVRINANDHPPPHFHVLMNDGREAWVIIADLQIVYGKVATREISDVVLGCGKPKDAGSQVFMELQQ